MKHIYKIIGTEIIGGSVGLQYNFVNFYTKIRGHPLSSGTLKYMHVVTTAVYSELLRISDFLSAGNIQITSVRGDEVQDVSDRDVRPGAVSQAQCGAILGLSIQRRGVRGRRGGIVIY